MVSFRKNLVLILAGVVGLNFFLVFLSFNYLMEQYIQREAESGVQRSVQSLARTVEVSQAEGMVEEDEPSISWQMEEAYIVDAEMVDFAEAEELSTISIVVNSRPVVKSIFSMDYVILDAENDVVFPTDYVIEDGQVGEAAAEMGFVVRYFNENQSRFEEDQQVRADWADSAIYISAASLTDGYSVLAFTDTSPIRDFTTMVNWTLGGLMILSGIAAVLAGIRMGGGMNKTLKALSHYAGQIGSGDFTAQEHRSRYVELDQLGRSMADMSQKLKLNDEQQKEFFQNASHELRTPLMSIQGYAEGIVQEVFTDTKEAAEVIVEESKEMAALVSQLLYISRLDSEAAEPAREETDLREILAAAVEKVTSTARQAGKAVVLKLPADPAPLLADPDQLVTAFVNVLDNGLRYATETVEVTLTSDGAETNKQVVTIQDDGGGIDPADLPHIFERLYKGRGGNAGLGLAITEKIIKVHDGQISVTNKAEGGALFTVILPVFCQV